MDHIKISEKIIVYLDDRIQIGSIGKEFKLSAVIKDTQKPMKWINNTEKWHWLFRFKYLDGSGFFNIEIDYYDNFLKIYMK